MLYPDDYSFIHLGKNLLNFCRCKIAEDVTPPAAVLKGLTLMSRVMPKAKLFPQKDLAELAFRESKKRKMVRFLYFYFRKEFLAIIRSQI